MSHTGHIGLHCVYCRKNKQKPQRWLCILLLFLVNSYPHESTKNYHYHIEVNSPRALQNNIKDIKKLIIHLYFSACLGSWGDKCRNNYPFGYYGFGCRTRCSCSYGQTCDPKQGCIESLKSK